MSAALTRRAALTGAVASLAIAGVATAAMTVPASITSAASAIEADWAFWKQATNYLSSRDDTGWEDLDDPIWAQINGAVERIERSKERTIRAAEIKLWLAVAFDCLMEVDHVAVRREDAAWLLANGDDLEPSTNRVLLAIQTLRGED